MASRATASKQKTEKEEADAANSASDSGSSISDGSDSDSGYDTDELINYARQSGKMGAGSASKASAPAQKRKTADSDDVVEAEFGFYDPLPDDSYALKQQLRNYIPQPFSLDDLARLVSNQVVVGTMVKADDQKEQPLGFASALNMHSHKDEEVIKQVKAFVLNTVEAKGSAADLKHVKQLLAKADKQPLGLLIHERVINLPTELVPALHSALQQDIVWAQENEITETLRAQYHFKNYILISRTFQEHGKGAESSAAGSSAPPPKKRKSKQETKSSEPSYFKFEDQDFETAASVAVRTPCHIPKPVTEIEHLPQTYVVMILSQEAVSGVVSHLESLEAE